MPLAPLGVGWGRAELQSPPAVGKGRWKRLNAHRVWLLAGHPQGLKVRLNYYGCTPRSSGIRHCHPFSKGNGSKPRVAVRRSAGGLTDLGGS